MKAYRKLAIVFLLLISVWKSYGQGTTVYGTVHDTSGKPLDQAWVMIAETKQGVLADAHGNWKIDNVQQGLWTVMAIYVGYEKRIKKIQVTSAGENKLDFILPPLMHMLEEVKISGIRVVHGMGQLEEVHDGVIYSGKKTEVLLLDSMDANTAQNNPRQVLGRIPGANFSETEGSGFPSNGIGFRGLNPAQSVELDTRQNGYNIAGDIYGYPESYYLPPLEAIERIEVIRGASSLQYGPQFGGVINYIVKDPPLNKPFVYTTEQTVGSYGLFNSFNGFGGTIKKWSYYGFLEYAYANGWRPNSQLQQMTGFAKIEYKANNRFKIGLEYSALRNMLHMPGGLDDASFSQDPGQSLRSRNWLTTPWNILALTAKYNVNDKVELTFKSALNLSQRNIVWRNEDGGPQAPDSISRLTNSYAPREVEHEGFNSSTSELRMLTSYSIHGVSQTLAAGVRFFDGLMNREEGGPGSTGNDFDMTLYGGAYANNLNFLTLNVAPFVENTFHIGNRLSVTPG
ncbi:MAG TPA: carboxypeptidase-like regulatory domain-containing protein, partial [Bacteroidia bacterium]|nr:carboxypeptidase-like regulatory domain-containing protein [Bacteroidia bacterium]